MVRILPCVVWRKSRKARAKVKEVPRLKQQIILFVTRSLVLRIPRRKKLCQATCIAAKSAKSDRFGLGIWRTGKNSEISLQHPIRREMQDPICEEPMEPKQMSFVQRMRLKFDRN